MSRPFWRSLMDDVETQLDSYVRGQSLVALCIAITAYIGTMITMDENTSELFQQLAKQVLELPLDGEN